MNFNIIFQKTVWTIRFLGIPTSLIIYIINYILISYI